MASTSRGPERRRLTVAELDLQPSTPPPPLIIEQEEFAFMQMERRFRRQIALCEHYKKAFALSQYNPSLSALFDAYVNLSIKDLDSLVALWKKTKMLPKFKFVTLNLYCRPCNAFLLKRELEIEIRTHQMPVQSVINVYVVGEYGDPTARAAQSLGQAVDTVCRDYCRHPNKSAAGLFSSVLQLDRIRAVPMMPYWDMRQVHTIYERPMKFKMDAEGLNRFVRLTFYELLRDGERDREIGTATVDLNCLNSKPTAIERLAIMNRSIDTGAGVEAKVRVHRPLVDMSMRYFEEQLLTLT